MVITTSNTIEHIINRSKLIEDDAQNIKREESVIIENNYWKITTVSIFQLFVSALLYYTINNSMSFLFSLVILLFFAYNIIIGITVDLKAIVSTKEKSRSKRKSAIILLLIITLGCKVSLALNLFQS